MITVSYEMLCSANPTDGRNDDQGQIITIDNNIKQRGEYMIQMTVQLPDKLAERCKAVCPWLPTVIELSLSGFKTPAITTVSEIIEFLCKNPAPNEVGSFHVSDSAQLRLRRLLTLNEGAHLSLSEKAELDELQRLEHIMIMLKIHARKLFSEGNN